MNTLTVTLRTVTPLFLGGAEPDKRAELRAPSIKGALRFWWRAIKWAQIRTQAADDSQAIGELGRQEAALFGSADDGQSRVLIKIDHAKSKLEQIKKDCVYNGLVSPDRPGARYLGYGVMHAFSSSKTGAKAGQLTRTVVEKATEFTVEIRVRDYICQEVVDALKLLGLLGGLGSKVRKGYGSLTLIHLSGAGIGDGWYAPSDADSYIKEVQSLLAPVRVLTGEPPFSAFSDHARVCLLLEDSDPMNVLDNYGRQMQLYRSWGHKGMVNNQKSEQNFSNDHTWYEKQKFSKAVTLPANFHPQRVVFGLPHNYGKGAQLEVRNCNKITDSYYCFAGRIV